VHGASKTSSCLVSSVRLTSFSFARWRHWLNSALPILGFSPKILGFSMESWVLGFFPEGLGFFYGFSKTLGFSWVFHEKIHVFKRFLAESNEFKKIR